LRLRKRSTSLSSSAHRRLTWLLLMPCIPSACTRSSTRRVEMPCTNASWTTATSARSARRRGSSRLGKKLPSRTRGTARNMRSSASEPPTPSATASRPTRQLGSEGRRVTQPTRAAVTRRLTRAEPSVWPWQQSSARMSRRSSRGTCPPKGAPANRDQRAATGQRTNFSACLAQTTTSFALLVLKPAAGMESAQV
jgi:hypothetical protein